MVQVFMCKVTVPTRTLIDPSFVANSTKIFKVFVVHITEACRENRNINPLILDLGKTWWLMVYFLLCSPYPPGRTPVPMEYGTGCFQEEKNLLASPGFEHRGLVTIPTTPPRVHSFTSPYKFRDRDVSNLFPYLQRNALLHETSVCVN
jgi:hypothetical protein